MALAAMIAAFIQHIRIGQILLDLLQSRRRTPIMFVMHGI